MNIDRDFDEYSNAPGDDVLWGDAIEAPIGENSVNDSDADLSGLGDETVYRLSNNIHQWEVADEIDDDDTEEDRKRAPRERPFED